MKIVCLRCKKTIGEQVPYNDSSEESYINRKIAEDVGSGTSKIIQWCKEWGLPEPRYEEAGGSFVTVFHNPKPEQVVQKGSEKSSEKGSERVISEIRKNPSISAQELAQMLGITSRAVEKHLSRLKGKGVINRIGPDKGGHWEVSG